MAAFSTTDEAVLTAPLELNPLAQSATASSSGRSIYYVYDILSTAAKIHNGRFKRIALQFPDEALVDSVPVYWALKKEVPSASSTSTAAQPEFYILADTSYGGCCVDEVAAKHVDADLVVHYGHACLSATARLPVIYVFTKQPLADVQAAAVGLAEKAKEHICNSETDDIKALVLTYDVSWDHVVDEIFQATKQALTEHGVNLPLVRTYVDSRRNFEEKLVNGKTAASEEPAQTGCCATITNDIASERASQPLGSSRTVTLPSNITFSQCAYLYLGPESLALTNLLLTLGASTPLISYNPLTSLSRIETGSTNRLLMKRYASVLKARDASGSRTPRGTLGVHSYLPLLKYLRNLLTGRKSGRKVYTISVGKLNPAKLANFQEIDSRQQRGRRGEEGVNWSGKYVLDLERLVPAEFQDAAGHEDLLERMDGLKVDIDDPSGNADRLPEGRRGRESDDDDSLISPSSAEPTSTGASSTPTLSRTFPCTCPNLDLNLTPTLFHQHHHTGHQRGPSRCAKRHNRRIDNRVGNRIDRTPQQTRLERSRTTIGLDEPSISKKAEKALQKATRMPVVKVTLCKLIQNTDSGEEENASYLNHIEILDTLYDSETVRCKTLS
ncbi:related to DPH2 - diphtheria toxin resistance protein [Ustilago trichophora]|uniref:2-(3-amino-3-carboxypropyl)histidine synthase subunit 2 n=1 Tax=Ustilago trichophora TaxID=86804 RepID=A0A5C3E6I8_9BASI|nr:related to DPH2 - diphtheria toxin resistance protein [Ustilago trichophora]